MSMIIQTAPIGQHRLAIMKNRNS